MKSVAIILGLLAALFAFLFIQKSTALTTAEALVATNQLALTNALRTFETELMATNIIAGDIRSNLQHSVDVRTVHLNIFSNRLVQANLLLQTAQEETRAAQAQVQSLAASNAVLAARQEDLAGRLAALARLEAQLAAARVQAAAAIREREGVAGELQEIRLEHADLVRKLDDVAFLRAQAEKAGDAAALRKQSAARPIRSNDRRLPLELQPDGTVRPSAPPRP